MHALRQRLVFLVVFTVAVLAFAGVAHANGNDDHRPSNGGNGNPGSVKVDDDEINDGPANEPHVVCALRIVVEHGVGAPFDIDFDALAPTTRAGDDQKLLIVHVPAGDNVSGLIDLSDVLAGITPQPQQGFHISITVHLPGGDKHKVIWVLLCPPSTTATTAGSTPTSSPPTANITTPTTTASTIVGGAVTNVTNTTIPTQVLGESFSRPATNAAGATGLANTGSPFSPALAVGVILGGLGLLGAARRVSGRRLEATMRRSADRES
jgi:hypothetical protein